MYVWLGKAGQKSQRGREIERERQGYPLGKLSLPLSLFLSVVLYLTRPLQHLFSSCWKHVNMGAFSYICALLHTRMLIHTRKETYTHTFTSAAEKKHKTITHTQKYTHTHVGSREEEENALINNLGLTPSCTHLPTVLHAHVNNRMCGHADTCADARIAAYHHYVSTHACMLIKLLCFTHSFRLFALFFSNTRLCLTLHVRGKKKTTVAQLLLCVHSKRKKDATTKMINGDGDVV